jgi:hypothetical protein
VITGRRAAEFHDLVEGAASPRSASYADLLDVVGGLRATPAPVADPGFVAALRERLITEAETVLAAAAADRVAIDERLRLTPAAPGVRRRRRRLAAAVTGVALVGGSATMAFASQSALPGDALYPVKRDIESAHAGLTFDRSGRGEVLLHSASIRLDETEALGRSGADPARVDEALDAFASQAIAGSDLLLQDYQSSGDEPSVTTVRTFTASSMARLHDLESVVPSASLPQLLQAAQALGQIESVSLQLCPGCSGPPVTSVPTVLTDATRVATGAWATGPPDGGPAGHHPRGGHQGPLSGPDLPRIGGDLPPGSVTQPPTSDTGSDVVSGTQVRRTLHDLTGGLTHGDQNTLGATVADTTSNTLDSVGQAGNTVTGAVGDTVGGVPSALPSEVTSNLPSLP